jgi:hypothetical protein
LSACRSASLAWPLVIVVWAMGFASLRFSALVQINAII